MSIVLFIAEGIMPVVLLVSLIFLFYILSTVPPENIAYEITNKGIKLAGKETPWGSVSSFYITSKPGGEVLIFDTTFFPGRMELVINPDLKDALKKEVSAYTPYKEKTPSLLDKLIGWMTRKLLENE